jgi:CRP-like cAMP-binding protein
MEAVHDPEHSSVSWVARLVEVLQPLSLRADRLAAMGLFAGLRWSDLEFAADLLVETDVDRGTRMTVQGRPTSRLWLITQGEALVSANARPLRVVGYGDAVGITSLLRGGGSPDTTIALTPIRALAAGPDNFRELVGRPTIRQRLMAATQPTRRRAKRPSSRGE